MAHDGDFVLRPAELLALIGCGAVAVVLLAVSAAPVPLRLDSPLVAHVTGLLGGYGVAVMLVLMSRTPVLERGVGADRLARWHGVGGRAIFALIGAHAAAATQVWVQCERTERHGGDARSAAATGLADRDRWHRAPLQRGGGVGAGGEGETLLRAMACPPPCHLPRRRPGLQPSIAGPDLAGRRAVQIAWGLLYTYAYGLVLRYRFVAPLQQAFRHRLRVRQIIPEADGVVSIIIGGRHLL